MMNNKDYLSGYIDGIKDCEEMYAVRYEEREAALRRIRAINDNPAHYCVEIENVCREVLTRE
jgi:hypothetical protein